VYKEQKYINLSKYKSENNFVKLLKYNNVGCSSTMSNTAKMLHHPKVTISSSFYSV